MKVKIQKTKVDEQTFVPTLVLSVELDVEQMINLINKEGLEYAKEEVGEMFFNKLETIIENYKINE